MTPVTLCLMTATADSASGARILHLSLPGLVERPAVGTSCCASTAEAIVAQELSMLPGIIDLTVDVKAGAVDVTYDPASTGIEAIHTALDEIGYPAVDV